MAKNNLNAKQKAFYEGFSEKLKQNHEFPCNYTFKFIVPTGNKAIAEVQRIFDGARPQFQMKPSRNNKYTSVTVVIFALDAESVIAYYQEAGKIENIIML